MFRVLILFILSVASVAADAQDIDGSSDYRTIMRYGYGRQSGAAARPDKQGANQSELSSAMNSSAQPSSSQWPVLPTGQADPMTPGAPAGSVVPDTAAQRADYAANAASPVFGAQLFTGAFSRGPSVAFNGDYVVSIGDRLRLRMWGGFDFDSTLTVDSQGSIFLPHAGPLRIAGVANRDLQATVTSALRRVFSNRVSIYVDLQASQPVRVYVAGFARHPGMYNGTSNDSVLRYLDQAGGVDPDRGSFIDVQVKRGATVRAKINLYDFLLRGDLNSPPLADGDVVFVGPRHGSILASGMAANAKSFEFPGNATTLSSIADAAKPDPSATHVRVTRNTGTTRNVEYFSIAASKSVTLQDGDLVEFTADKQPGTITVRVEGEHIGPQEYVLPYGSRLGGLLSRVQMTERSSPDDIQLFRASVKDRQKQLLQTSLQNLEMAVLTARSGTEEEARLRTDEAALALQWVDRARKIEPQGQAVIGTGEIRDDLLLENGDVLRVPARDGLVLVGGEVLFPNTIAADDRYTVDDYIAKAGGFSQAADGSRIVVAHLNGTFSDGKKDKQVVAGDEILVLPKVDFKTRQFAKDVFQILYQVAISAKVALGL
ncbi:polysaccharide biosynthesis/export family protein [Caballeronia sp. INDeC2]|uniref:polysaccharide biosynthesis/export family protein n=1 Tax=Caballeronia sp. INDeC2 TaxID=2921747 RepID=UPI002028C193|nr:polysaccharide biosynthesis/export family protein [Caballeronia sp. INDeC2]